MGDKVNGPVKNTIASFYMVLLTVVAIATIPLMIATKAGIMNDEEAAVTSPAPGLPAARPPAGRRRRSTSRARWTISSSNSMTAKTDFRWSVIRLSGPGASAGRVGGRIGTWIAVLHRRLHEEHEPDPARVPFELVAGIHEEIELRVPRSELESNRSEEWAWDVVVSRIPGARHEDE